MSNSNDSLFWIAAIWLSFQILDYLVEWLDLRQWKPTLPKELEGFYDAEKYAKSRDYHADHHRLNRWQISVSIIAGLVFLFSHGFEIVDQWARGLGYASVATGLIFFGVWGIASQILGMPFRIYRTFVIEEKYGFNKTTVKTFIGDLFKGAALSILLGAPLLGFILWFFEHFGFSYWAWVWAALVAFQLVLIWVAPVWILPLFNKLKPLDSGDLKSEIESFARAQAFELGGIFTMDGSKRTTKANAFFTGFGKLKRIVLFDTLITKHTVPELVAVLAHEIGHYRMSHIQRQLVVSILSLGVMLWLFSQAIQSTFLFEWFQVSRPSVYMGLFLFSLVYSPVSRVTGLWSLWLSRRYEFEADAYSINTYAQPQALVDALKRLSTENLSNLTPHPLKVFLEYTHPPVLQRLRAIQDRFGVGAKS